MRSLKNTKSSASEIKIKCVTILKEKEIQENNMHSSIRNKLANWWLFNK